MPSIHSPIISHSDGKCVFAEMDSSSRFEREKLPRNGPAGTVFINVPRDSP